jgi:phage terminase small subunit
LVVSWPVRVLIARGEASMADLTPKQRAFIDEYLVDLNATQAAIRAGYSPDTAGSIGHENLKKPEIAAAIAERKAKRSEDAADRASRAARRLEDIALMDLGDSMKDVPPPLLNVVQGAEVNLLKLDGKFSEKHEHKAMVTVVIEGDDAGLL